MTTVNALAVHRYTSDPSDCEYFNFTLSDDNEIVWQKELTPDCLTVNHVMASGAMRFSTPGQSGVSEIKLTMEHQAKK